MSHAARALWRTAVDVEHFARIHFMGFSVMWPILGAISVAPRDAARVLPALLAVTLCFHLYAAVLNDVVDLDVDRTQPLRANHPLVRGALSRRTALAFALAQVPLAFVLLRRFGAGAAIALATAFVFMAIYDLWGKRCPVPPLTDAAQGVAWGALACVGAFATGSQPNALTAVVFAYAVGYLLLINGVHGGVRDLENDFARGTRTTAIFLGMRLAADGVLQVPQRAWRFCFAVQGVLVILTFVPLARNDVAFSPGALSVAWAVTIALAVLCLVLMRQVLRPGDTAWEMAYRLHLAVLLWPLVFLFAGYAGGTTGAALIVLFFLPIILMKGGRRMVRFAWDTTRARLHLALRPTAPRSTRTDGL